MIIVKLKGGLGNQMFQYAFAKYTALKNNEKLFLDTRFYDITRDVPRYYELGNYNINSKIASYNQLSCINKKRRSLINRFRYQPFKTIKEQTLSFTQSLLDLHGNLYFDGYWQNENYFKSITEILKKEFTLKHKLDKRLMNYKNEISKTISVSLHIRRGDYLEKSVHDICSMEYYKKAIRLIFDNSILPPKCIFVFTDDYNWAIQNFMPGNKSEFIVLKNYDNIVSNEYLYLMSLCKHNIIANSSFSWWAAWLNQNHDKIIVAPQQWFTDPRLNKEAENITPRQWIRI